MIRVEHPYKDGKTNRCACVCRRSITALPPDLQCRLDLTCPSPHTQWLDSVHGEETPPWPESTPEERGPKEEVEERSERKTGQNRKGNVGLKNEPFHLIG